MLPAEFTTAMRRIVTGMSSAGGSAIAFAGSPSCAFAGLHEIWRENLDEPMDPGDERDRGPTRAVLSAEPRSVAVRWFVVEPVPTDVPRDKVDQAATRAFESIGARANLVNQDRDPTMHRTDTFDVVCLISGRASLITDQAETPLEVGQVVIQRGTAHAWRAHGGPALFLAILIGREMAGRTC